jgi:hypothetical protein
VRLLAFVRLFVLVVLFLSIGSCSRSRESLLVSVRAALEISCLSFSQWQDTEMTRALINRISLAAMVVASPTSEVRISPVTEAARINLVVRVGMAIRTNPAVAMEINPVAMAAKISPAMEEEEGQAKTCPVVAVIRMQQTLRKTKMAMETPVIMVPTLRPILLRWPLTKRSRGDTATRRLQAVW